MYVGHPIQLPYVPPTKDAPIHGPRTTITPSTSTPTSELRCITFNCNGLTSRRLEEVHRGILDADPDVVLLQELKEAQTTGVHISGYRTFLRKRTVKRGDGSLDSGGGIATLVRSSIKAKIVFSSMRVTERLDVRCTGHRGTHVTIANVYRPGGVGKGKKDTRKDDFDAEDLPHGRDVFIAGDFNLHDPLWDGYANPCPKGRKLANWLQTSDMHCWNNPRECTFASGEQRSSPDLVISSTAHEPKWRVLNCWGSDHRPVQFTIPFRGHLPREPPPRDRWAWHFADWTGYRAEVGSFARKVLRWSDPHESANSFASAMKRAAERHIGYCGSSRRAKGWWTAPVSAAIKARNTEANRQRRLPQVSAADAATLRSLRMAVRVEIDKAKREKLEKIIAASIHGNPKPVFDFLRRADGRAQRSPTCNLADDDGEPFTTPAQKATRLGEFYAEICGGGGRAPRNPTNQTPAPRRDDKLDPSEADLTRAELEAALLCLSPGNSAGPDGVPTPLLIHLDPVSRCALLHVLNLSWVSGVVPASWRSALISPLPKPDKDTSLCSSYRPIALTSNVCKVLERILKARLSYLVDNPATDTTPLNGCQSGFQRLRSTAEQVALFAQSASDARTKGRFTTALFFDMAKAFDTVSKEAVHAKLEKLSIPLRFRAWIRGYLRDRVASVVVDGVRGPAFCMLDGVPQGTVLSPFLFTCLVDDISTALEKMDDVLPSLFADDVAVLVSAPTLLKVEALTQEVVLTLELLCPQLGLNLSKPKSVAMPVGKRTADAPDFLPPQFLDGSDVPVVKSQRFLGVLLDSHLDFKEHLEQARSKFRRRLFIIRTLRGRSWGASKHLLRSVFLTFVLPCLSYCFGILGPFLNKTQLKDLNSDLAWAARIITGCSRHARNAKALWEARLEPAEMLIHREAAFAAERFARLPGTNGFRAVSYGSPAARTWLDCAQSTIRKVGVYERTRPTVSRAPLCRYSAVAPWDVGAVAGRLSLQPFIAGFSKALPTEEQYDLAAGIIDALSDAWLCYTDGSVAHRIGGAGVVLFRNGDPTPTTTAPFSVGVCASSYRAEMAAILFALRLLCDHMLDGDSVALLTDSQSAVRKLCSGASAATEEFEFDVWTALRTLTLERGCRVTVQFVPGHAGLEGNELADAAANAGRVLPLRDSRLSFICAKSLIRSQTSTLTMDPPELPPYWDPVCEVFVRPRLSHPRITRAGETLMSLIRVEWHPLLRSLSSTAAGHRTKCLACGRLTTLHHLFRACSATRELRKSLPAAKPLHELLFRYEVSVLAFLVSADLVPGPVTLYVTPRAAAAAVPTITVAAAVAAAVVSPAPEAGLLLWA